MRPAPATSGYRWNRFAWWLADRFQGRRIFGRTSWGDRGWRLMAGKVKLPTAEELERRRGSGVAMDVRIYDPEDE